MHPGDFSLEVARLISLVVLALLAVTVALPALLEHAAAAYP